MAKAKFTEHGPETNISVTVEYTDVMTDLPVCRTFFTRGGYVHEMTGAYGQRDHQVCARLSNRGSTLMIGEAQQLIDIIRREYRAMRAADQRRLSADA